MTRTGNFEEIQLSDSRFTATTPSDREISEIYTLSDNLIQRFASEIRSAAYESGQGRTLSDRQRAILRLSDARTVWRLINESTLSAEKQAGSQIIGVRDASGNLQAGAMINLDFGDFIYVKHFATAPENILPSGERAEVKGAGLTLMELMVRYSINLGFDGAIKLIPKERSLSFYTQIGFQRDARNEDLLILIPQKAQAFLANK